VVRNEEKVVRERESSINLEQAIHRVSTIRDREPPANRIDEGLGVQLVSRDFKRLARAEDGENFCETLRLVLLLDYPS